MPKYLVKELSLIGNELHPAGATVEYDGLPAGNLEPLCDEGRAKHQEYLDSNAKRVASMKEQFTDSAVGDPEKFAAALGKALAEDRAIQAQVIATAVAEAVAAAFEKHTPAADTAAAVAEVIVPAPVVEAKAAKGTKTTDAKPGDSLV